MSGNTESLSLKWGTLKRWNFTPGSPAYQALMRYNAAGSHALGAAQQHDNAGQKQAIIDIIDAVDCDHIHLDWDGENVSKDDAKKYVLEYGRD